MPTFWIHIHISSKIFFQKIPFFFKYLGLSWNVDDTYWCALDLLEYNLCIEVTNNGRFWVSESYQIIKRNGGYLLHTVVIWLICRHSEIGNSTYMKVILTKKLTFITIIYHTKFQFAKMSRTMKKNAFFSIF